MEEDCLEISPLFAIASSCGAESEAGFDDGDETQSVLRATAYGRRTDGPFMCRPLLFPFARACVCVCSFAAAAAREYEISILIHLRCCCPLSRVVSLRHRSQASSLSLSVVVIITCVLQRMHG